MSGTCPICGGESRELRIRVDQGGFGPVDIMTCESCHSKEIASVRAESRRIGIRLTVPKPWEKLTSTGFFSSVASQLAAKAKGGAA